MLANATARDVDPAEPSPPEAVIVTVTAVPVPPALRPVLPEAVAVAVAVGLVAPLLVPVTPEALDAVVTASDVLPLTPSVPVAVELVVRAVVVAAFVSAPLAGFSAMMYRTEAPDAVLGV